MTLPNPTDPGAGKFRVGFQNLVASSGSCSWYDGIVHHGFVNVPQDQISFNGDIKKATLKFTEGNSSNPGGGQWKLTIGVFTSDAGGIYLYTPLIVTSTIGAPADITSAVVGWRNNPAMNHGLIFFGPDDSFQHNNYYNISTFGDFKLEIETTVK